MRHNFENLKSISAVCTLQHINNDEVAACAVSVPSNIAEGSERGSDKEFGRFLSISSGSASELFTQLKLLQLNNKGNSSF